MHGLPADSSVADEPSAEHAEATTQPALTRAAEHWWWPGAILERISLGILAAAVSAGVVLTIVNLIMRGTMHSSLVWLDEAGVLMLNIVAFLGAAVAYRRRRYLAITWIDKRLPARAVAVLDGSRDLATLLLALLLVDTGWQFAMSSYSEIDPYLRFSEFWLNVPLPVGAALVALFAVERLLFGPVWRLLGVVPVAALTALLVASHSSFFASLSPLGTVVVMAVAVVVLLVLGLPLPFVFGISSLVCLYLGGIPMTTAPSDLLDSNASFILVVVPFFLLTGFVLGESGLSRRLGYAARVALDRVPGSLLHVVVVSMFVFSGISGSKVGDMAAVGSSAFQMAKDEDYPPSEVAAALSAGAAMGDTVPPSTGLIVLSSVSLLPITALFVGGILPAVTLAIALAVVILLRFRRASRVRVGADLSFPQKVRVMRDAFPVVALMVLLVGSIVSGIATPSEASAIAVVVSVLLCIIYRGSSAGRLVNAALEASVTAGLVMFIIATATLFARLLTLAEIPQELGQLVTDANLGRVGFLLVSTALLVVAGMILEGLPAILVFAPLLIPVASQLGVNSLQYGIVLVIAIGIGAHSPPIGVGLYSAAQMGQVEVTQVARRMRYYLVALYVGLIIVTFVPQTVTWLPQVLHIT
jgi:tripartite ATP-independent transporter DctM subunit